ncbi:DUF4131 domain-containing protein, partial [bacterium]|nr:DUF4131 domain-containing protein [bacterium]
MYRLSIYVAIGLSIGCTIGLGIMPFWLGLVIATGLGLATAARPFIVALIALPIAVTVGLGRTALIPTPTTFKLAPNTTAVIDDFPRYLGDTAYIAAHGGPKNHRLLLKFYGPPPTYGDTITFTGHQRHRPPATNPGQPDQESWSRTQRIVGPITVDDYTVTDHDFRNPLKRIAHVLRNKIVTNVNMAIPPPYGDLLIALTLGDSGTSIPEDLTTAYQTAGLTHLLVVSGSQVSLIIGIGTSIIGMLRMPTLSRIGLLTLLNVFFYCLCGGGASILRAVIMSELSVVTEVFKNPTPPLQLIGVTILIFVLIDPTLVANIGAHLSFLATAALVWGVPSLARIFPTQWPEKFRTVLAMSLAPFLMTFPVLWAQFHSISVISLIANIMVTPLIEIVVVVGMAAEVVTLIIPPIGIWGLSACHAITILINGIATTTAKVPHALVHLAHPPTIVVSAVMIGIVTTLIQELIPNRTIKIAVLVGCAAIFIGYTVMTATTQQPLRIIAIDVDQGDSTLIMTPGGKTILIDAGNHIVSHRTGRTVFNAGKERVVPLLNYYGIDQ